MRTAPPSDPDYVIRRSDGRFYGGTVDREAVFTSKSCAARFDTEEKATTRAGGLLLAERKGRTFEVLPVGARV